MKSQPHLLNGWKAELWCRFFLLSVFATMYLNDIQRAGFYATIGLDAKKFDIHVIRKTNQSSGRLFPVILDVDHPSFFEFLEICAQANTSLIKVDQSLLPSALKFVQKIPSYSVLIFYLLRLFFMKPIDCKKSWDTIY
jgi:magnesium-protoporphyrin IX monomethyl ester (oxidative) cyclase